MSKTFVFVDSNRIDGASRKSIRSHVMKGKNTGRIVHRPSKIKQVSRRRHSMGATDHYRFPRCQTDDNVIWHSFKVSRNLGSLLSTLNFPIELTPHSVNVVNQFFGHVLDKLYPRHLGFSADEAKVQWLGVILTDEGASHCSMALMEASNGFFLNRNFTSPEALRHVSKTYSLVRERLEGSEALSDGTIGMILMLILQEQIRKEDIEAAVHFEGLKKMILLRGGLDQLESNLPLLLKICKVEISRAIQSGQPLLFHRHHLSEALASLESAGLGWSRCPPLLPFQDTGLHPYLADILKDAMAVRTVLNNITQDKNLELFVFQEIVVSICSRLLHFCPLGRNFALSAVDAAYHIGLLLFMMTLFLQHGSQRAIDYTLIIERLEDILDDVMALDRHLALWITCLGAIWAADDPRGISLQMRALSLSNRIGLSSWCGILQIVSKFPWVSTVHNESGQLVLSSHLDTA